MLIRADTFVAINNYLNMHPRGYNSYHYTLFTKQVIDVFCHKAAFNNDQKHITTALTIRQLTKQPTKQTSQIK